MGMLLLLGGCGVSSDALMVVEPLDKAEFRGMIRVMRPQLVQKGILDENGAWRSPAFSLGRLGIGGVRNGGETLLRRLSPAFRFPGLSPDQLPSTFQGLLTPEARVDLTDTSFSISQGLDVIDVAIIAFTDWNRDGTVDWLLRCRIQPRPDGDDPAGPCRDYYLALTDRTTPVLVPQLLAIRDSRDGVSQVFFSPDEDGLFVDSPAVELLEGQAAVTEPPGSGEKEEPPRADRDDGSSLKERTLSE
jgi:hypothetical protein